MRKFLISLIIMTGFAVTSFAQASASATASATATIVAPINIEKATDMSFGNIAVHATNAGTVVLNTANSRSVTGGITLPTTAGTVTSAAFTVTGQTGYTYAITLPGEAVTLTRTDGEEVMTLTAFTSLPSATGTLTSGTQSVKVGATLNVEAAQVPGTYSNETAVPVMVVYN